MKTAVTEKTAILLLSICFLLQIYDLHIVLAEKNKTFRQETEYIPEITDGNIWDLIGNDEKIKHIVLTHYPSSFDELYALTDWALRNGKTMNLFYFSRTPVNTKTNIENSLAAPDCSELFLFKGNDTPPYSSSPLNFYSAGGYIIGYAGILEYADALPLPAAP